MIQGKSVLALIPARGGSKRLPGKNVRDLGGKPLIGWSIEAARNAEYVDRVMVSTDDAGIAAAAQQYGAEVPFMRPAALANDTASTNAVILHCLESLAPQQFDIVVVLQPTSPLRNAVDIDQALAQFVRQGADGVVSVCECEHSPLWSNTLPADNSLGDFLRPEVRGKRSQDLPGFYRLNGAMYVFSSAALLNQGGIHYSPAVYAYVMPAERSVDIDSELDFKFAELLVSES
ncbi:acylneuraminate cytidylyltransferase family protein [Pseudomaricurvus alcaniphilus]|uniref:acylneuraminate cytidylyltransferase family protein n=1 Tax=Pseudomaricurvus alcaniphilus TaxID=1166482 RepID=UPI0014093C51|nr:acylneuraminate cytidylyltransferase family protein [Pseudomaricurvus alcaniphilus]NHN39438.1 acylneuraminate cytidylyltransferase family protein [Pseudomaricurvus alcaniphilus]